MTIDKKTVTVIILTVCFILFGSLYSYFREQGTKSLQSTTHDTAFESSKSNNNDEPQKTIKIYITGEINNPGIYELPEASRINDAVEAAGGATEDADLDRINLAAHIKDAQQINIPVKGTEEDSHETMQSGNESSGLLNINTASAEELTSLPQVGPAIAENIIRYREENGDFQELEDIKNVSRIGEKTFENIKDLITVD